MEIEGGESNNSTNSPEVAFLWGAPQGDEPIGTLVKLPAGFTGKIAQDSPTER